MNRFLYAQADPTLVDPTGHTALLEDEAGTTLIRLGSGVKPRRLRRGRRADLWTQRLLAPGRQRAYDFRTRAASRTGEAQSQLQDAQTAQAVAGAQARADDAQESRRLDAASARYGDAQAAADAAALQRLTDDICFWVRDANCAPSEDGWARNMTTVQIAATQAEGLTILAQGMGGGTMEGEGVPLAVAPEGFVTDDVAARRVSLRVGTQQAIIDAAPQTPEGDFIDPNTGQIVPRSGPFDFGHKPGFEWWRTQQTARAEGWTRQQLIEYENDPTHYQIEDPNANRSHAFEMQ